MVLKNFKKKKLKSCVVIRLKFETTGEICHGPTDFKCKNSLAILNYSFTLSIVIYLFDRLFITYYHW